MGFGLRNHTSLPTNMSGVVIPEDDQNRVTEKSSRPIHIIAMFNLLCSDGIRIRPESTPHQLGIQDGDEIDVFRVQ
ncbi:hypothetical protein MKW92_012035 [Papaver armeniacum]|nr:hypothetical protein MKW92_012035 [Papaver armeniacum]